MTGTDLGRQLRDELLEVANFGHLGSTDRPAMLVQLTLLISGQAGRRQAGVFGPARGWSCLRRNGGVNRPVRKSSSPDPQEYNPSTERRTLDGVKNEMLTMVCAKMRCSAWVNFRVGNASMVPLGRGDVDSTSAQSHAHQSPFNAHPQ
jgi:hypothetical protein